MTTKEMLGVIEDFIMSVFLYTVLDWIFRRISGKIKTTSIATINHYFFLNYISVY